MAHVNITKDLTEVKSKVVFGLTRRQLIFFLLAALVVADSVFRLCPGVLACPEGYEDESYYSGLLEYPQYSRPEVWHGCRVPEVLLSGHHANIAAWRKQQSLERTKARRPDLYAAYTASHPEPEPKKKRRAKKVNGESK